MNADWPSAKRFLDPEIVSYFEMCVSEGDPVLITTALGDMARAHGMEKVAQETGLSIDYLQEALSVNGNPDFSTVVKVVRALGLTLNASSAAPQRDTAQFATINDTINRSGRLSMLSQRLAKCYLQIGQSISTRNSKKTFESSMISFDQQLIELKKFAHLTGKYALIPNFEITWVAYKKVLTAKAPNKTDATSVITMSEQVLAMTEEITVGLVKFSDNEAGKLVNIASRQRMLSQRMAKYYQAIHWGLSTPDAMAKLLAAHNAFVDSLTALSCRPTNTPDIRKELELAREQWANFVDVLFNRIVGTSKKTHPEITMAFASERLLEKLEIVTNLYAICRH